MATIFAGPSSSSSSSSSILPLSSSPDNLIFTPCHFIYSFKFAASPRRRRPRISAASQPQQRTAAAGGGGTSISTKLPSYPLRTTSKEKKSNNNDAFFEGDPIADLNARIRRDLRKREASGRTSSMDPGETDRYIQLVKMQQQRGLQKLKGDRRSMMSAAGADDSATQQKHLSYKVDPYTLRSGDYVVHKKVGIGRFVAIKNDVPMDSSVPIEYVFIEFGDGMAKLPVNQASRFLYRYNL